MPKGVWNALKLFLFACESHNSGDENSETCDWCLSPHIEFSECKRDLLKTDMRYPQKVVFSWKKLQTKAQKNCMSASKLINNWKKDQMVYTWQPCLHEFLEFYQSWCIYLYDKAAMTLMLGRAWVWVFWKGYCAAIWNSNHNSLEIVWQGILLSLRVLLLYGKLV